MADETRRTPDEMLVLTGRDATVLSVESGPALGADLWPVARRLAAREGQGPGLVQTRDFGLVSGLGDLAGPAATSGGPAATWDFAAEAPEGETLRLESPAPEVVEAAPARKTARSLFATDRAARKVTGAATRAKAAPRSPSPDARKAVPAGRPGTTAARTAPATALAVPGDDTPVPALSVAAEAPERTLPAPGRAQSALRPAVRPAARATRPAPRTGTAPAARFGGAAAGTPGPAAPAPTLMSALRLQSPAPGTAGGPQAPAAPRRSGPLVTMDVRALAAGASRAPAPAPRAEATTGDRAPTTAPEAPRGAPAFGPTPLSRGRTTRPADGAPANDPGMQVAFDPAPDTGPGSFLRALGPALARVSAVGDRPSAGSSPSEGALPEAAFVALAPDTAPAPDGPAAAPGPRSIGRTSTGRPAAGSARPAASTAGSPVSPAAPATLPATRPAPAVQPWPSAGTYAAGRASPARPDAQAPAADGTAPAAPGASADRPGTRAPAGVARTTRSSARTPRAAGSLTLSVPSAPAPLGAAAGRSSAPADTAPARWLASTPGPAEAGAPGPASLLDLVEAGPRALLQIAGRTAPEAAAPAGPAPVLPRREARPAPADRSAGTGGASFPTAAGAPGRAPGPRAFTGVAGLGPEAGDPSSGAAESVLAALGPALARAAGPDALPSTLRAVDAHADRRSTTPAPGGSWDLPAEDLTLLAQPPEAVAPVGTGVPAAPSRAAGRRGAARTDAASPPPTAGRAPAKAGTVPAARTAAAPAPAPRTTAPESGAVRTAVARRRDAAVMARAGTAAADHPLSVTGLGVRPGRRPPAPSRTFAGIATGAWAPGSGEPGADGAAGSAAAAASSLAGESPDRAFVATTPVPGPAAPDSLGFAPTSAGRGRRGHAGASPAMLSGPAPEGLAALAPAPGAPLARGAAAALRVAGGTIADLPAAGTPPGRVPAALDLPLPEGFDLVAMRSPLVPAFQQGGLAPAAGAAESLWSVRRTLMRSLGALPPAKPDRGGSRPAADGPGTAPGAPSAPFDLSGIARAPQGDLVEWIRTMGGGRPADAAEALAAAAGQPGQAGRPPAGAADDAGAADLSFVEMGPGAARGPVHPEAVRGDLPGLPRSGSSPRVDVSLADRGLVSPGGIATALAALGVGGASAATPAGPAYHGTLPLISTGVSAVAATAMASERRPGGAAATAAGGQDQAREQAAKGQSSVDLDGLAAEMTDRILRRLRREKERRGFHG